MASLAGNDQIDALLMSVWDQILIATRAGLTATPRVDDVHREHETILQAVADGLPDKARIATTAHVEITRSISLDPNDETKDRA